MGTSENKKKYDKEYAKKYEKIKGVKLNKNTDKDIFNHLDYLKKIKKPFSTYVKELIRKDIEESKK